jgi:hypothetical protein
MLQSSRSGHSRESRLADAISVATAIILVFTADMLSDNLQDQLREATPLQSMKHEEGEVKTRVEQVYPDYLINYLINSH